MPKISVIVPVFNVEKYLKDCLDSIIKQSIQDIEIILVDDGSEDSSGQICDQYAEIDDRIKVIHKTNGGLSDARNCGLRVASAQYVGFIDSDDCVDLNFYEKLYHSIKNSKSEIAVSAIWHFDGNKKLKLRQISENTVFSRPDAMKELLISKRISNSVCNKLFEKKLFDDILFPAGKLYEDEFVTYRVFDRANFISVINETCYHYRYNVDSITHSAFNDRELDRIKASQIKIDFCKVYYPELQNYAKRYLVYDCISALAKMEYYSGEKYNRIIRDNIRRYFFVYMGGSNSFPSKLYAGLAAISPKIVVMFRGLIKR
ncbi:glycosyltransferase involved in cell wall biosynthesis [Moryella indoligenes]|uniref:Glycosyltransferase involved in cell wall biosynthesis n=1 Tax=Moryella indoligenes TaxID=371674 RepID=A0AAE3VBN4_9FIRM|nr:glycosyltransferase [Moryella indoligenes]MDQ0152990.1 glycosyltransferase involved in cell wall biosynthesis [Moryella indoligenes]